MPKAYAFCSIFFDINKSLQILLSDIRTYIAIRPLIGWLAHTNWLQDLQ